MARFEDNKVTLVQDGKDVATLNWEDPNDRAELLRMMDNGKWKMDNDKQITEWKNTADELEENRDTYNKMMQLAGYMNKAKAGEIQPDALIKELEDFGIKLTKEEKKIIDDEDLDPVSQKLLSEIEGLKGTIKNLEQKTNLSEQGIFNTQLEKAEQNLVRKYDGKNGYPKYEQKIIDDHLKKHGDNVLYHPDIEKQYELIYEDINREAIRKAERSLGGMSEAERQKLIKDAQGPKGGGGGKEPTKFVPVPGDVDFDAASKAIIEEMNATGRSLEIED